MWSVILVCVAVAACTQAGSAPFITPCHAADNACLKSSAQKAVPILAAGVPDLGLATMDPMTISRVKANQAGLDMDFRNTVVKGLRNCNVMNVKRNGHKTNLEIKCSVTLVGDYKLNGTLLVMPIEGNGKYKIKLRDILVKIQFNVEEKTVGGTKYWSVPSWKHTSDVLTNVEFQFQNLFNGNKQLSDAIHQFANSNWKDIYHEVAPPIVKAIVTTIVAETVKLFDKVPLSELALD